MSPSVIPKMSGSSLSRLVDKHWEICHSFPPFAPRTRYRSTKSQSHPRFVTYTTKPDKSTRTPLSPHTNSTGSKLLRANCSAWWVQGYSAILLMDTAHACRGRSAFAVTEHGLPERLLSTYCIGYRTGDARTGAPWNSRVCFFKFKASVPRRRPPYTLPR